MEIDSNIESNEQIQCDFCNTNVITDNIQTTYRLVIITDKFSHQYGLVLLLQELNDYLFNKGIHLSSSQIVLLRPDILKEYLETKFPNEEILDFILDESLICNDCFKVWKEQIPLK